MAHGTRRASQAVLILFAPLLFMGAQILTLVSLPPFWRQLADPIYQYLLNGVAIVSGVEPGHTDHPGTSMQWLMGAVQWLTFQLIGQGGDFATDVVERPELYLTVDSVLLIVGQFAAFTFASFRLHSFVGIKAAIVFQALVLAAIPVFAFTIYPVPEALVWISALLIVGLIAPATSHPRMPLSLASVLGVGLVLAVGGTAKIIFLPVFALILIWLRVRDALLAIGMSAVSAIAIMWPVRGQFNRMWEWFTSTAGTSARYPDEIAQSSGAGSLITSPGAILQQYPWALVVIALLVMALVAAATGRIQWAYLAPIILGPVAVLLGLWSFTYKAWRPNDLMVFAPMAGLLAAVLVYALFVRRDGPRWGINSRLPPAAVLVLLVASAATFSIRVSGIVDTNSSRTSFDDLVDFLEDRWEQDTAIAYGYGVFSQASALTYANGSSAGIASKAIVERHPNWLDFNIWNSMFYRPGVEGVEFVSCITLQEIARSPRGLLLAPGRDVEILAPNQQYESLLAVPEARLDGLEVLRVIDVECGPQWYAES